MPIRNIKSFVPLFLILFFFYPAYGQLCQGSLGDPVVNITFGSGSNPGRALDAAATSYTFIQNDCPGDGQYTIRNRTTSCFGNSWHTVTDHTGDPDGYFMLVNGSFEPGDFYLGTVKNLCGGTTYEFAAWINNVLANSGIKPNLTFTIEKVNGTILKKFQTEDIFETPSSQWKQFGFFFDTPTDVFEVVLRIRNNAPGGRGNDLALDDITFRPCGPMVTATIDGGAKEINVCDGSDEIFNFSATVSEGYSNPTYQWQVNSNGSWQDIPGATTGTYRRLATVKGSYQYRITVASAGNLGVASCRIASNAIKVNVRDNPVITLTNDGPQCEGNSLKVLSKVDHKGTPGTVSWSGPGVNGNIAYSHSVDNTLSFSEAIVANASPANAAKFYFRASNSFGCSSIDSTIPVVHNKPVAAFSMPLSGCEKADISFADASTITDGSIVRWNWNFGNGGTAVSKNASASFARADTYPVKLLVESDKGCKSDTVINNLIIHEMPTANFILPKVCLADPFASFIDSSWVVDDRQKPFSYSWDFGDPAGGAGNASTLKNPQYKYSTTGNYNVKLSITTSTGCVKDTAKIFTVNGSVPKSVFMVENSSRLCSNENVLLVDNSTVDFGSINKVEILWDQNNPGLQTIDNSPSPGKKYAFKYPVPPAAGATAHTIVYRAYSGINCVDQSTQTINLNASPQVSFSPLAAVCEEAPAYQISATELTGAAGSGSFSGNGINSTGLFTPAKAGPGTHTIMNRYVTNSGCADTQYHEIIVHPQPIVNAGDDILVLKGTSTLLKATASGNDLKVLWSPATYLNNPSIINPKSTPLNETLYTLTAVSSEGCTNKDEVLVEIVDKLYIPNAFTPNGDGVNDGWFVPYFNSLTDIDVKIFNRYGQLVFHTSKENKPWDGKVKGIRQPSGAYVYIVESKENNIKATGTLVLIQ